MKTTSTIQCWGLLGIALALSAPAQAARLEVLQNPELVSAIGGRKCTIPVILRNPGTNPFAGALSVRVYETSSTTAAPLEEILWKEIQVLPNQTLLESASITFPVIKGKTQFVLQWIDESRQVLGVTAVAVFPINQLTGLQTLAGKRPLGVLNPGKHILRALKTAGLELEELDNREFDSFTGRLAILGPYSAAEIERTGIGVRVRKLAAKGVGVVWIVLPDDRKILPSFYLVPVGNGAVAVVQSNLFTNLAENPAAQLNLVRVAELAVRGEPLALPDSGGDAFPRPSAEENLLNPRLP